MLTDKSQSSLECFSMMIALQTYLKVKSLTIIKIKMSRSKCQIYKFGGVWQLANWHVKLAGTFRIDSGYNSLSRIFEFQTCDVSRALALYVGFRYQGSGSWDEIGAWLDSVKPVDKNGKLLPVINLVNKSQVLHIVIVFSVFYSPLCFK